MNEIAYTIEQRSILAVYKCAIII